MKIALVAPLYESVPPKCYGGTERVVAYLAEELVALGHQVTLFASADSRTSARLIPCSPRGLRLDTTCIDPLPHHLVMVDRVCKMGAEFDVVHFHIDYLHYPLTRIYDFPHLTTLHGTQTVPDLVPLYREYPGMPVISISDAQRAPLPWLNWQGTVYHGLPPDLLRLNDRRGDYLAFLGRISPEKGLPDAIAIARESGVKLKIAAKIAGTDREYYHSTVEPLIDGSTVEYIGEIDEAGKQAFLGEALALILPLCWDEPFGLVMIEAMACGTPVIVYARGSAPEVVTHGITGFLVKDEAGAVAAARRVAELNRRTVREVFDKRFLAGRMTSDYLALYQRTINKKKGTTEPWKLHHGRVS